MKKLISLMLCAVLLWGFRVSAGADDTQKCVVVGADLTSEQILLVYKTFGVSLGSVTQLSLSNAEERKYLEGFVEPSVIGTRSISCVYVELLPPGSGMSITTSNISWCTGEMYTNALATAGITDAKIMVAAPFPVSGTAALAGIYKAYEDMVGQDLDSDAKLASTQELTVTGELAQEIGSDDSTSIVQELKRMLSETQEMTDEELRTEIVNIASKYRVSLTETQIKQLISLCRSIEGLNPGALKNKAEDVQSTIDKVSDAKTQVVGFVESIKNAIASVQSFIEKIQALLDKFGY